MTISSINFTTTRVTVYDSGKPLGTATGFFFRRQDGCEFLVTNRHVVIDEERSFKPDTMQLRLHQNREFLDQNTTLTLSLYNDSGRSLWLEHSAYAMTKCDVIAIPMSPEVLTGNNYELFKKSSVTAYTTELTDIPEVNPFGDVVVLGYPQGFYDDHNNLPVYRKAMIASQFGVPFQNNPYFLVDANLHQGMSGSPVVNSHHTLFSESAAVEGYKLFGIHSAQHMMNGEPLGLNVVWYSSLIVDIVQGD
ncbi:MAG: trypsin-like peptidase domain-containing protein [Planctomycetes bacterium]|nr:trypsin-like peptidase domain-containing protein [Planctomycetota bacterium]